LHLTARAKQPFIINKDLTGLTSFLSVIVSTTCFGFERFVVFADPITSHLILKRKNKINLSFGTIMI